VLSPITWLASKFEEFDPKNPTLSRINLEEMPSDADYEALILANSLSDYIERIEQFIDRERAFTRDVSHELRTPLTVINMAVQVMEADGSLPENDKITLARIKGASKDMLELVEVFLILARESDGLKEDNEVSMRDVIEYQIDQSEHLLKDKDIVVTIEGENDLVINSSPKVLEVMLGNLIQNAIKYTNEGSVKIEINNKNILVKDSGIGMSEKQISQVFTPYFRASTRPSGGHGVGLTIVKRISDRFNWPVKFESEEGKGTTVTVDFN
jgi:signal transduction histidine kinase